VTDRIIHIVDEGTERAYRVLEGEVGQRLVIEPLDEPRIEQVRAEIGVTPISRGEFEAEFGHLPTDHKG
jgi:hypothetical protein